LYIPSDSKCQALYQYSVDAGPTQLNTFPTRDTNMLDLVFTDDCMLVSDIKLDVPFCTSDYCSIRSTIVYEIDLKNCSVTPISKFFWNKADWIFFKTYVSQQIGTICIVVV